MKCRDEVREKQFNSYFDGSTIPGYIASLIGSGVEKRFRHKSTDKICVFPPPPSNDCLIVTPFYSGENNRLHDSERILFNVLHQVITDNLFIFDTVLMITERIPCESCTNILIDFAKSHKVNINIVYWIDTGKSQEVRDFEELKNQIIENPNADKYIKVFEIFLKIEGKIHLIEREFK
ncbi:deaminase domain-containing protein [Kosakonia sp. BK9b]